MLKTIKNDEEFLRQVSLPVDLKDKNLKKEIDILENYCLENEVFAMASVQLGILKK